MKPTAVKQDDGEEPDDLDEHDQTSGLGAVGPRE